MISLRVSTPDFILLLFTHALCSSTTIMTKPNILMLPMLFVKSESLKFQTISLLKQEIIEESVLQVAF